MTNKDEIVQKLIKIVQEKKQAIEKAEKPKWETNCVLMIDGKTSNIRTIRTIENAIELYTNILSAFKMHSEACGLLGVSSEFKFNGFSFDQWTNDFKNVTTLLNLNVMKSELAQDEAKLDKLVSKEKREELELLALMEKYDNK